MIKILIILLAFNSFAVFANDHKNSDSHAYLASHPQWLKLLRYEPKGNDYESAVTSQSFFLNSEGRSNPLNEVQDNLLRIKSKNPQLVSEYKCQFPERYRWLRSQMGQETHLDTFSECEEFWQWAKLERLEGASLVYASGYLGNPASFFGHLLLKFNYSEDEYGSNLLLDNSINFGAAIPPEDGAIVYVLKGFFGGYFASFKDDSFYRHHRTYAEQESRTLWQYDLNLSTDEVHSLVSHVWELREQNFDYFYLNDNCASRMAELLSVIKPELATNIDTPWVQPISIFKSIAQNGDTNFLSIKPIASHYQNFVAGYQSLSQKEKEAVLAEEYGAKFDAEEYAKLSNNEKRNVLNVMLDYSNYQQEFDHKGSQKQRQQILIERFKFPAAQTSQKKSNETQPHLGQLPSTWRYGAVNTDSSGIEGILQLRPTYYDLLSSNIGRLPYSSLGMGTTELGFTKDKLFLSKFYLADILSLAPPQTDLERDKNFAWKIKVGLENTPSICLECLTGMIEVGLGRSAFYGRNLIYGLGEIRLQSRQDVRDHASGLLRIGALVDVFDNWRTQLEFSAPVLGYEDKSLWTLEWNNRFGAGIHSDWRLNLRLDKRDVRVEALYSYYWQ